jgi:hypothetical protein
MINNQPKSEFVDAGKIKMTREKRGGQAEISFGQGTLIAKLEAGRVAC